MICSGAEDHASLRTSMDGNLLKDWHVFSFDQTLEQFLQSTRQSRNIIVDWEENMKTSPYLEIVLRKKLVLTNI